MDAEVPFVAESLEHRVRYVPDPHLESRTIFNEPCDALSNAGLNIGFGREVVLEEWAVSVDKGGDPVETHDGIAMSSWHLVVNLGDDNACRLYRGFCNVHRGAQGAKPVMIRR